MRLVRSEDIGILLMSELARAGDKKLVSLSEIASVHGVSVLFLKKIVRQLKSAGLVTSKEGSGGGYSLAYNPDNVTLWQIIEAVAEKEEMPELNNQCPLISVCLPQTIHNKVYGALSQSLSAITLTEIVQ